VFQMTASVAPGARRQTAEDCAEVIHHTVSRGSVSAGGPLYNTTRAFGRDAGALRRLALFELVAGTPARRPLPSPLPPGELRRRGGRTWRSLRGRGAQLVLQLSCGNNIDNLLDAAESRLLSIFIMTLGHMLSNDALVHHKGIISFANNLLKTDFGRAWTVDSFAPRCFLFRNGRKHISPDNGTTPIYVCGALITAF